MIVPSQDKLEKLWSEQNHREVAKWLPYFKCDNPFIKNLRESNLLQLKDKLSLPALTLGADPEFILCEKDNPTKIVMFSSEYTSNYFDISEAEVGADYGLLEFRVPVAADVAGLIKNVKELHQVFETNFPKLKIMQVEAVEYNHEMARIRNTLELKRSGKEAPSYGGYQGYKETSVWSSNQSNDIVLDETSTITLSAYGKPEFKKYRPDILSAGGHIHIGGTFIKSLSLTQLNKLIQKFDREVLPLCETVETGAAKLRKIVYGAAGEYRFKEYGIEYRSPSNAIFFKENLNVLDEVLQIIVKTTRGFMFG